MLTIHTLCVWYFNSPLYIIHQTHLDPQQLWVCSLWQLWRFSLNCVFLNRFRAWWAELNTSRRTSRWASVPEKHLSWHILWRSLGWMKVFVTFLNWFGSFARWGFRSMVYCLEDFCRAPCLTSVPSSLYCNVFQRFVCLFSSLLDAGDTQWSISGSRTSCRLCPILWVSPLWVFYCSQVYMMNVCTAAWLLQEF